MKKRYLILSAFLFIAMIGAISADGMDGFIVISAVIVGILLIVKGLAGRKTMKNTKHQELPSLSRKMEQHYEESGMSKQQIILFRDTMNSTKDLIFRLQDNIAKNAKLKAIDLRHDTLRASKGLFKELVKEPKKLPQANHFLYTHLPNIVDLTDKYIEINSHEIKTKETYAKIEESAKIIDQMADLIASDYQQFVADDIEDLDVEMTLAKRSLNQENLNESGAK